MLIRETDYNTEFELPILEEYKDSISLIPVRECSRLAKNIVRLEDIMNYVDRHNMSINEALDHLATVNHLDRSDIILTINESKFYMDMDRYMNELNTIDHEVYLEAFYYNNSFLDSLLEEMEYGILNETEAEFRWDKEGKENIPVYPQHGYMADTADNDVNYSNIVDYELNNIFSNLKKGHKLGQEEFDDVKNHAIRYTDALANTGHIVRQDMFKVGPDLNIGDYSKKPNQFNKDSMDFSSIKEYLEYIVKMADIYKKYGTCKNEFLDKLFSVPGAIPYYRFTNWMFGFLQGTMRSGHDALDQFSAHFQREQMPRSWIARLIHWLRSLYQKVMFKWGTGIDQTKDLNNLNNNTALIDMMDLNKIGKVKPKVSGWKLAWSALKYTGKTILKTIASKILFLIDRLLQKLQNMSDSANDKVRGWLGMELNK